MTKLWAAAVLLMGCVGQAEQASQPASQTGCTLEWPSVFGAGAAPIVLVPFPPSMECLRSAVPCPSEFETCYREDTSGDYMCQPPEGDCRYAATP